MHFDNNRCRILRHYLCENSDLKLNNICYNITPVVVYLFRFSPILNSIEDTCACKPAAILDF